MKIKTSELTRAALEWAVAKIKFPRDTLVREPDRELIESSYGFSTDWAQGGPIIEREQIDLTWTHGEWQAGRRIDGPTPLIAAMRCYVSSKLGDEVDVPDELVTV